MNRCGVLALFSSSLLIPLTSMASFYDPVDGQFDMGHHIAENATGFLPIPILITEPAVGYGGGVAGLFLHESEEEKRIRKEAALKAIDGGAQLVPSAMSVVGALGTENETWFVFGGHRRSWMNDSIRYTGGGGFGVVNLDLYLTDKIGLETSTAVAVISQQIQFRVATTPWMLGVKHLLAQSTLELNLPYLNKSLKVNDDSVTSGIGLTAEYDTRDNLFYPTQGYRLSADYMIYDDAIGSDSNYRNLNVEAEGYIPVSEKWTLGLAGNYQNYEQGDGFVSPTAKPYVELRGVSSFRYQGDEIETLQGQLTYSISHRWKVSGFYGSGKATERADQSNKVNAGGVGFRYQIARRYGLHLGMDYAQSHEERAIYFNMGSGF
ncbi:BamA/TamA family outer membrane protein [Vibrio crassostreae]|uniref:BamA/TamA family outer membrane protein n=1 Tax=Vibrio crassostreae TaxID=246167 RepID=UPI001044038E|nr:BamA/TamA family outer membrane protein [Vibrio crassostreae]TCN96273.1 surface antigen-like protein [Vibrio crassostreae]CAK1758532.1 Surface antigen-like protein [Vibrio crassostreae]CAK1788863.1 Surface antigen-like protein [Vibrio crassostreae]CAK2160478.1 Surface antigen-like protein [Vibrio crassostreae]CAK2557947.1 Surface antigen-like protein [Vibrio crassostreae]